MKSLPELLAFYGGYHRDRRNKIAHFIGVPLITFSILIPMGWLRFTVVGVEVSLAVVFVLAVLTYYFFLDAALAAVLLFVAYRVANLPSGISAAVFTVTFLIGWCVQLVGHVFEGRKPALLDDFLQVIVAPIFLTAELFFAFGAKRSLCEQAGVLMRRQAEKRDRAPASRGRPVDN